MAASRRPDYTSQVYAAIKLMAINLGRFAQDMAFWTSFEVGQLRFSDGFVQISSIMPQKRNPVPVEHMRLNGFALRRALRSGADGAA